MFAIRRWRIINYHPPPKPSTYYDRVPSSGILYSTSIPAVPVRSGALGRLFIKYRNKFTDNSPNSAVSQPWGRYHYKGQYTYLTYEP